MMVDRSGILICAVLLTATCRAGSAAGDEILATYDGGTVTMGDLRASVFVESMRYLDDDTTARFARLVGDPSERQAAIKAVAFDKILADIARKRNVQPSDEDKVRTKEETDMLLYKIYYLESILPEIRREEARWWQKVQAVYAEHRQEFRVPAQYWFRYIFCGDPAKVPSDFAGYEKRASEVERLLKSGADFVETARKYSDSMPPEERGTLVGPVGEDKLTTDRLEILDALKEKEISKPFRSQKGYMIIRLERRKVANFPDAKEVSATLVARGLVPRFMREVVMNAHNDRLSRMYPMKLHEDLYSSATKDLDTVVAESSVCKIRNGDVFTRQFRLNNPYGEAKDVTAAIQNMALRASIAGIVTGRDAPGNKLYRDSLALLKDLQLAGLLIRSQQKDPDLPQLKDYTKNPTDGIDSMLKTSDFRFAGK